MIYVNQSNNPFLDFIFIVSMFSFMTVTIAGIILRFTGEEEEQESFFKKAKDQIRSRMPDEKQTQKLTIEIPVGDIPEVDLPQGERLLWHRDRKRDLLSLKFEVLFTIVWTVIILGVMGFVYIYSRSIFAILIPSGLLIFLYVAVAYTTVYDQKVKRNFPLSKAELRNYREYDILTNKRLIQKRLDYYDFEVPDRWRNSRDPDFGKFRHGLYPEALLQKEGDALVIDLTKIKVIIDNRHIDRVYLLGTYFLSYKDMEFNFSEEEPFGVTDPYEGFAYLDFHNKDAEQTALLRILEEEFDLKKTAEGTFGAVYAKDG